MHKVSSIKKKDKTVTFDTINQFDKKYSVGNFTSERSACSLFSLLSVHNFMKSGNISKKQHLNNIDSAVANYMDLKLPGSISFAHVLHYTDGSYTNKNISATSPELINQGIISYDHIFKPEDENKTYAVMFLKFLNFFTVLVKSDNNETIYSVRDCHEKVQHDFYSRNDIIKYLNKTYKFNKNVEFDGVVIDQLQQLNNIEFVVMDNEFNVTLKTDLEVQTESNDFEIVGFDSDSDDIPDDDDISDNDDYVEEGLKNMAVDLDMQMAMALQQEEFGDKENENNSKNEYFPKKNKNDIVNSLNSNSSMNAFNAMLNNKKQKKKMKYTDSDSDDDDDICNDKESVYSDESE
jgi:hypothetical protein